MHVALQNIARANQLLQQRIQLCFYCMFESHLHFYRFVYYSTSNSKLLLPVLHLTHTTEFLDTHELID